MTNIKQARHRPRAPISAIIPCYQAEKTLIRAVNSILEQSLQVSEIIIIDDGSTDDTLSIARQLALNYKDLISIVHFDLNKGVSEARNEGWNRSSYQYVAFLDADDAWHPNKIKIQYDFLKSHPDCVIVGHKHQIKEHESQQWLNLPTNFSIRKIQKWILLLITPFATPTVIVKRNISLRFDADMRHAEDYSLWLQVVFFGLGTYKIDLPLAATFKPNYGVKGLSYNLVNMKKGIDKAFFKLYQQGSISLITLLICLFISYLKHFKRLLVVKLNWNFRKYY
jgi:glycosyltransferase involved in cell wall biosynthesis